MSANIAVLKLLKAMYEKMASIDKRLSDIHDLLSEQLNIDEDDNDIDEFIESVEEKNQYKPFYPDMGDESLLYDDEDDDDHDYDELNEDYDENKYEEDDESGKKKKRKTRKSKPDIDEIIDSINI